MSRRRVFGSLCTMVFLVSLGRVLFAPLLSELIRVFGITEATAGFVATLTWLGSALPRLPTGWLLTRLSRLRITLLSGAVLAVGSVFTAAAPSVVALGAGALVVGVASGVYFVAASPLVSELYPARVGRMLGVHGTAAQLSAVVAAPFVTLVLATVATWRVAFVALGAGALAGTLLLATTARRTDLPTAGEGDRDLLGAARAEWPRILFGVVVVSAAAFTWQGMFNFYELYMRSKGLSPTAAKNLLTVVFAAGVPAFFFSGQLVDRLPAVPYLLGIVAGFGATVLALTVAERTAALVVLTVVVGYVIHSLFPAIDAILLGAFPDETRASAYAVFSATAMVLQSAGSTVVGALVESGASYDAVFRTLAVCVLALVVVLAALGRAGRLPA